MASTLPQPIGIMSFSNRIHGHIDGPLRDDPGHHGGATSSSTRESKYHSTGLSGAQNYNSLPTHSDMEAMAHNNNEEQRRLITRLPVDDNRFSTHKRTEFAIRNEQDWTREALLSYLYTGIPLTAAPSPSAML